MSGLELSAQMQGAWTGLLSPPAGVAPPSAAYRPPTFGAPPAAFTVEVACEEGLAHADIVTVGGARETVAFEEAAARAGVAMTPWQMRDAAAAGAAGLAALPRCHAVGGCALGGCSMRCARRVSREM